MDKLLSLAIRYLRVPGPIAIAILLILIAGYWLTQWDPERYPDLKTVFTTVPWMSVLIGFVGFGVLSYYLYLLITPIKRLLIWARVNIEEIKHSPPQGMVVIPSGNFIYRLKREKRHLAPYFIDEYPVTNEQYLVFCENTRYQPPPHWEKGKFPSGKARHPVVNINWHDANEYIKWRASRDGKPYSLPSEEEWEKAARGPFGFTYPWGTHFKNSVCNAGKGPSGDTNEVGAFPSGRSPFGCYDMVGNVWEWTRTLYDEKNQRYVLRGGSYYFDEEYALAYLRYHDPKEQKWEDLGFRCVSHL
jgi:formylglycine-generating enzyme required for sulfatase activity